MKLRRENRNSRTILHVEGELSLQDCDVLSAGLRKLLEEPGDWVIDLSAADIQGELPEPLRESLLEGAARCRGRFWIIGPQSLSHFGSLQELDELENRGQLEDAKLESWYDQQTAEARAKTSSISEKLRNSGSPEVFELRRENSRLRRRLHRVTSELESLHEVAQPHSSAGDDGFSGGPRQKILASLEHALFPKERQ